MRRWLLGLSFVAIALAQGPDYNSIQHRCPTISVAGTPYFARGDGIANDLPAFIAANSSTANGGTIYVPPGTYLWSASSGTELLLNSVNTSWNCDPGATIVIASGVPTTIDWYRLKGPSSGWDFNCRIIAQANSHPGQCGLKLDATSTQIYKFHIHDAQIGSALGPPNGYAACTVYPSGSDGIFDGVIERNIFTHGLDLVNIGDSIDFKNNEVNPDILAGGGSPANPGPGVTVTQVVGAGTFRSTHNSITACNGSIVVTAAWIPVFDADILEPQSGCAPGVNSTLVDLQGASGAPCPCLPFSTQSVLV